LSNILGSGFKALLGKNMLIYANFNFNLDLPYL
jgi:hypothetical protein